MYVDYNQTASNMNMPQQLNSALPPGYQNPYGIVKDTAYMTQYKDVRLTKGEAYNWNIFSFMDNSNHCKQFEVAPRLIR
jgi:hypothetical protein